MKRNVEIILLSKGMECYEKVIIDLVLKNGDEILRTRAITQEEKLNIT